eukprot:scaffold67193_cov45-Phaeocystis_antarctica.AAC.1
MPARRFRSMPRHRPRTADAPWRAWCLSNSSRACTLARVRRARRSGGGRRRYRRHCRRGSALLRHRRATAWQ